MLWWYGSEVELQDDDLISEAIFFFLMHSFSQSLQAPTYFAWPHTDNTNNPEAIIKLNTLFRLGKYEMGSSV